MPALLYRPARFDSIRLIWRTAPGKQRRIVGTLTERNEEYTFRYDGTGLAAAQAEGFQGYPGLPDLSGNYNGEAMLSMASRLPSRERADFDRLVSAWGANSSMTDFQLLGATGGRLPTDMFEFVSQVVPEPGTEFFSDVAGIDYYVSQPVFTNLSTGTPLDLVPEPSNQHDSMAIEVRHRGEKIGYVKTVHCEAVSRALQTGIDVAALFERSRVTGFLHEVILRLRFG
jgi:hypothetical protein